MEDFCPNFELKVAIVLTSLLFFQLFLSFNDSVVLHDLYELQQLIVSGR